MATLAIAVIVVCLILCCFAAVPAYTGANIINRVSGSLRSVGPGIGILWPWEKIVSGIPLKKNSCSFESDFETQDKATLSLKISFDTEPLRTKLMNYERFDTESRMNGIKERIRSILSAIIYSYPDRGAVMSDLKELAAKAKKEFENSMTELGDERIEEYYGTNLVSLMIADVALPQILKDAAAQKEAQEKQNEARRSEMDMIKQMAKELVAESGGTMMYEDAIRRIQVQLGKVKDENKTFGLDKGTQQLIKDAIKGVMTKITVKEAGNGQ